MDMIDRHAKSQGARDYVVLLDLYSVHRSSSAIAMVRRQYPDCHLAFIPAGMTAYCQPLDVALNGPLKAHLRGRAAEYFAKCVVQALKDEKDVQVDLTVGTM